MRREIDKYIAGSSIETGSHLIFEGDIVMEYLGHIPLPVCELCRKVIVPTQSVRFEEVICAVGGCVSRVTHFSHDDVCDCVQEIRNIEPEFCV